MLLNQKNFLYFKWKCRAGAGAEAGAGAGVEIMDNGGAKKEPESKINNFGSATLHFCIDTTPLHEAAQKGRTWLCALLLAHGSED